MKPILIIAVIYVSVFMDACSSTKMGLKDVSVVSETNMKSDTVVETIEKIEVQLIILNNPFELNNKDEIQIWLNDTLIYKGVSEPSMKVYLSPTAFMDNQRGDICIKRENKFYFLFSKRYFSIDSSDKYLYLVFCPTNDKPENFILFGQKKAIL
jgi:hypothetical protein